MAKRYSDKERGEEFSGRVATKEVERFLAKDGPDGVNVETGWTSKTKYTGKFNDA
jgi:hypothetical protein